MKPRTGDQGGPGSTLRVQFGLAIRNLSLSYRTVTRGQALFTLDDIRLLAVALVFVALKRGGHGWDEVP